MMTYAKQISNADVSAQGTSAMNLSNTATQPLASILVVDDNPNNLKLVHHLLTDHDYKIRLATNGQMALNSVQSNPPDLILLDITMPGMDGYAVCEILKSDPVTRNIPVIFLSAIKESVDIVKGFSVGGIDFVTKPFKPEILLARINTHLTINHLQNELLLINNELEKRVETRTKQIAKTNSYLVEEMEKRLITEDKLRESEEFHRLTLENLGDTLVITTDQLGNINYISPNIENILEYTVDEILQSGSIYTLFQIDESRSLEALSNSEIEVYAKNGDLHILHISIQETHIRSTVNIYTCQDITKRKQAENERKENATRLRHALTVSNEGIWDWDIIADKIIYNDTFFTMLGRTQTESDNEKKSWLGLLHPQDVEKCQSLINDCITGKTDSFQMEYRLQNNGGDYLWVLAKGKIVERDNMGKPTRFVGTHTDIKALKESEARLRHQASYDTLTQLPNRALFMKMLKNAIAHAKRSPCQHAVLYLDLDRFKNINDSLGHAAGDKLLSEISERFSEALRETDIVARLGGDEFTVLLQNIASPHKAAEISNRIIEILKQPFDLLGHQVVISPSIGIVIYPEHGSTPDELLKNADTAMYCAKRQGGCNFEFFSERMNTEANARLELEADLRDGLEKDEIIQYYQPKVSLDTGELSGLESLARWRRNGKLISPARFIPIAEETGLIIPMGKVILRKTLEDVKNWVQHDLFTHKVAVNISAIQFRQKDILEIIDTTLKQTELPPEYLELEITEAAVMENTDSALKSMNAIKDRGITLALDDFGTGYSSLSYLKKFPIDTLKIDRSFINDMESSSENKNIVKSIVDLAHNLKLEVVAEGVETHAQVLTLSDMECDTIQGYFYSKPEDQNSTSNLLKTQPNLYAQTM